MTPGQLIRRSRLHAGLSQAALAQRAGTSQPVVSSYEHDRRDPSVSTLRRLLEAAGARLDLRTATIGVEIESGTRARTDTERAHDLVDLLLLTDAIPSRPRGNLSFPRISSR